MTDLLLFGVGFVITLVTIAAVLLIVRSEAEDPALHRTNADAEQTSDSQVELLGQGAS